MIVYRRDGNAKAAAFLSVGYIYKVSVRDKYWYV